MFQILKWRENITQCNEFFPPFTAGGGGGVDKLKGESPRCHGTISQEGNPGYGGSMFQGGSSGRGAEEGDNGYSGGGGGGLKSNGRNNKNFGGAKGTGGEGGKSFVSGKFVTQKSSITTCRRNVYWFPSLFIYVGVCLSACLFFLTLMHSFTI